MHGASPHCDSFWGGAVAETLEEGGCSYLPGSWSSNVELLGRGRLDQDTSESHENKLQWLLRWATSLKVVGIAVMNFHQDLQSFQAGFLGLGGSGMGLSKEAWPVTFALACSGMYAANTLGLGAGQGQVEQHNASNIRRRIDAWMCQSAWVAGWHSASNFSWLLCISCAHLPSHEPKGKATQLHMHPMWESNLSD